MITTLQACLAKADIIILQGYEVVNYECADGVCAFNIPDGEDTIYEIKDQEVELQDGCVYLKAADCGETVRIQAEFKVVTALTPEHLAE